MLGGLWFTPLFGNYWDRAVGFCRPQIWRPPAIYYLGPWLGSLIAAFATAILLDLTRPASLAVALKIGFVIGAGYGAALTAVNAISPTMPKTTCTYWNLLLPAKRGCWQPIPGLQGQAEQLTLNIDPETGDYTRLTRFLPGADTAEFGGKPHDYSEEVFIVSGRLYDAAFGLWLERGYYASRPPGNLHGPFKTDVGCVVQEVSFPNRVWR